MKHVMNNLSLSFRTATRQDLVTLAHDVARAIPYDRLFHPEKPYLICITGDPDSGKSLFWDEIKCALFKTDGSLDSHYSEDLQSDDRIYEAWNGKHIRTNDPLRVFFCNMDSLFLSIEDERWVKRKILSQSPATKSEMGDILILSNAHLEECDIHIDLKYTGNNHHNNWLRTSTMTIKDPAIASLGKAPLLGR